MAARQPIVFGAGGFSGSGAQTLSRAVAEARYVGIGEDAKNPTANTLYAYQSGLGLPDRDYYLSDRFKDKKAKYRDYVAQMLDMAKWSDPQKSADAMLAFETKIAEASWSRAESRDRDKTYNPMTPAELDAYAPGFAWSAWLAAADVGGASRVVVRQNTAFPKVARIFAEADLQTLKAWQAFHTADEMAPLLSKRFADASFEFRSKFLNGQPQQRERWKRAVTFTENAIGEAIGRDYVRLYFPPDSTATGPPPRPFISCWAKTTFLRFIVLRPTKCGISTQEVR